MTVCMIWYLNQLIAVQGFQLVLQKSIIDKNTENSQHYSTKLEFSNFNFWLSYPRNRLWSLGNKREVVHLKINKCSTTSSEVCFLGCKISTAAFAWRSN